MNSIKKYIAEFIGTAVLVLFACGTAAIIGCDTIAGYLMTALSFGLVIVAMAYSVGNISGCHINPAVSIAMLVSGKMSIKDFVGYIIAQFAGAIAGAWVLMEAIGKESGLGTNALCGDGKYFASIAIEIILTFVFVFAILGVTSKKENSSVAGFRPTLTNTPSHSKLLSSPVARFFRRMPDTLSPCSSSVTALFQRNSTFSAFIRGS